MRYEMTYAFKNDSKTYQHVEAVLQRFGSKATFNVGAIKYRILDIKAQGRNQTLLFLGQGVRL